MLARLIDAWHGKMAMPIREPEWYPYAVEDEMKEYVEAIEQNFSFIMRTSEAANVLYCITRSQHDFFPTDIELLEKFWRIHIILYMLCKMSARRLFFLRLSKKLYPYKDMYALRNPRKIEKLRTLAQKHSYDEEELVRLATRQLRYWPLLP